MFCREYFSDLNTTQEAIRAGYSDKTANVKSSRLLINVNIQNRIKDLN
ncbi:terminase small subunit [Providencia rettgeri]